jgi:REP element-mobilizing transposase RayT
MGKVIGYMVTWTTYGTWLQGSERGYVKDGEVRGASAKLKEANKKAQKDRRFILTKENCELVRKGILEEAGRLGQEVRAMAISTTHIHIVVDAIDEPIETAVARYKRAGTKALRKNGVRGTLWTRGFDKRFCFGAEELSARIEYVNKHGNELTPSRAGG